MARNTATKWDDSYNRYINGQYDYSSTAAAEPLPERRPSRPEPSRPDQRRQKKKRGLSKVSPYNIAISRKPSSRFLRMATFFTVFAGAFLIVFSMAYIESRKLELTSLQNQLKQLKTDNIVKQGEILDNYDLAEVERFATTVLGMVKPQEDQVVYVDATKVSYIEQYDVIEEDVSPMDVFWNILSSVKGLFKSEPKKTS